MKSERKTLGLALSGGGHRATIFALGALLYLVDSRQNTDVKTISSVSGGSITNAFLASLDKPFSEFGSKEFDMEATRLAKQIAGSMGWMRAAVYTYALIFFLWLVETFSFFPQSLMSERQLLFLPPLIIWAFLIGPRSGGTLWKWWGTWLYVGLIIPLIIVTLGLWWYSVHLVWWQWLSLLAIIGIALYFRYKIAEHAFNATLCSTTAIADKAGKWLLKDLPSIVRHVFCSTEVHSGRHAYFSHDLVYAPYIGIGIPFDIPVSTAVQASTNFPVGFPFRPFFRRRDWREKSGLLVSSRSLTEWRFMLLMRSSQLCIVLAPYASRLLRSRSRTIHSYFV